MNFLHALVKQNLLIYTFTEFFDYLLAYILLMYQYQLFWIAATVTFFRVVWDVLACMGPLFIRVNSEKDLH